MDPGPEDIPEAKALPRVFLPFAVTRPCNIFFRLMADTGRSGERAAGPPLHYFRLSVRLFASDDTIIENPGIRKYSEEFVFISVFFQMILFKIIKTAGRMSNFRYGGEKPGIGKCFRMKYNQSSGKSGRKCRNRPVICRYFPLFLQIPIRTSCCLHKREAEMSTRMNESQIKFRILQKHETTFQTEDSLLLLFGLEGTAEAYIEDRKYILGTGGVLAVEPGKLYRISALRSSLIVLHVPAQIRKAAGERKGYSYSYHCYSKDDEGIQPLFLPVRERYAALFYEYLQNHHEVSGAAQGNLMQLLQYLREHFSTEREVRSAADGSGGGQRGRNPEKDPKAAELLRLIDEQWNEDLSLSILAERAHFSVSYLSRYFQKITSMGFSAYLRKVRLIHARQFLTQGELSVTQIAYDCGFRNPSVFIETFKQEYGMTPGQFRQGMMDAAVSPTAAAPMRDQRSDLSALLAYMPEKETDEISLRKETIEIDCAGGEGNKFSGFSGGNITGERSQEKSARGKSAQENDSNGNDSKGKDSRGKDAQEKGAEIIKTQEKSGLWERILNIGYAREGLLAEVQNQIRRAQAEVGFTYFRCHGLLDGDMYIYREDEGGNPYYTFSNMDALFDFVTELGLTPIVELGFMPEQLAKEQRRIFDRPSVISGCAQPEKWKDLICAVVEHLAARYG